MCVQNIIVIAGFSNVSTLGFRRGDIEAKEWNAWTRNSIDININDIMKASRDVSSASVAKQSMSEESRVKVSAAPFTSCSTKFGNSGIMSKDCHMGSSSSEAMSNNFVRPQPTKKLRPQHAPRSK